MPVIETVTSRMLYPQGDSMQRMFALGFFTVFIALWNLAGHTILGFEQSYAQPLTAVAVTIAMTLLLEWLRAWAAQENPRFLGGWTNLVSTLMPALIPAFAVGMLVYCGDRLWPIAFAAALSIASKALVRVPFGGSTQHVFNPSNFGITITLLLFPAVGLAPPYHFTENLVGVAHWILPLGILASGIFIHAKFTGRLPLCAAWMVGFFVQALVRSWLFEIPLQVPLMPMTSAAFILFTLYMIPDPATTPREPWRQVAFGLSVAAVYGVVLCLHLVFGLFIALFVVCLLRAASIALEAARQRRRATATGLARLPSGQSA